mmetsp:Transcript_63007/g.150090  ORF Transcript_63007/g.150090 Transcript_63007/m.150090 type:complete len:214 (+) Transcript_63007:838-1479(+)
MLRQRVHRQTHLMARNHTKILIISSNLIQTKRNITSRPDDRPNCPKQLTTNIGDESCKFIRIITSPENASGILRTGSCCPIQRWRSKPRHGETVKSVYFLLLSHLDEQELYIGLFVESCCRARFSHVTWVTIGYHYHSLGDAGAVPIPAWDARFAWRGLQHLQRLSQWRCELRLARGQRHGLNALDEVCCIPGQGTQDLHCIFKANQTHLHVR